ncbi:MAG: DUF1217 domain-containing protein [Pseudomonadota bacterium]
MYSPIIVGTGFTAWTTLKQTEEQHLTALKADPQVARDTEYFLQNIGSAVTVDDLLADRRLLEVALTAFGLETEVDKTAFIEQVLDGGVRDSNSFANRLNDDRWSDFTRAFGYGDPNAGVAVTGFQAIVELAYRPDGTPDPTRNDIAAADLAYLRANIAGVTSVDDLLADDRLLDTALASFGLERGYYNDNHFRQLLTEGLREGSYATTLPDRRWLSFTRAFSGLNDGQPTLTNHALETSVLREFSRLGKPPAADQALADQDPNRVSDAEIRVFRDQLETAATADAALANDTVLKVTLAAFGLGADPASSAEARAIFSAAAGGDLSLANAKSDPAWRRAAEAVQAAWDGSGAVLNTSRVHNTELSIAQLGLETLSYMPVPDNGALSIASEELSYFQTTMPTIETAQQLVDDTRLRDVVLRAFGLETETITDEELLNVLEQDPTDPLATVNDLANTEGWTRLATAYQGDAASEAARWRYELEERLTTNGASQDDIDYLRRNWGSVDQSLDILVDPRLTDIVLSAFNIENDTFGAAFVTRMLIDDPSDPNSFVQRINDPRWTEFADLFAPRNRSNVGVSEFQQSVVDDYHEALLRIQVGAQNESLRVALYFEDAIGDVAAMEDVETLGWATIMGDEQLRVVTDALFNLPPEFVQLDIDAQIEVYRRRSEALFGADDPSVFLNADNVRQAVELYVVRSDIAAQAAAGGGANSALSTLMGQAVGFAQGGAQANALLNTINVQA